MTSIRYAKENDRENRERRREKGSRRDMEGGRDKREREVKGRGIERESERKKIERKRRFLLQFFVKYPKQRSGEQG